MTSPESKCDWCDVCIGDGLGWHFSGDLELCDECARDYCEQIERERSAHNSRIDSEQGKKEPNRE